MAEVVDFSFSVLFFIESLVLHQWQEQIVGSFGKMMTHPLSQLLHRSPSNICVATDILMRHC